jgi:hypothetical protein
MFFILIHGWDGTGYQRFLSITRADLDGWTWAQAREWLTGPVAIALALMGVVLIPWLLGLTVRWLREGAQARASVPPSGAGVFASVFAMLTLVTPLLALGLSFAVRELGIGGLVIYAALAWAVALRKGGLLHRHFLSLVPGATTAESPAVIQPLARAS